MGLFASKRKSRKGDGPKGLAVEGCSPHVAALAALAAELPRELRQQAFTHYTWVEDDRDSYKRLAFIGDSVLGLFIAEDLHARLPDSHPGWLSQIRSRAVSGISCDEVGRELGIPSVLEAIEESRVRGAVSTKILLEAERPVAEITEALIGASYLTFGFERTRPTVLSAFEPQIQAGIEEPLDPKSLLQKLLSRRRTEVSYEVVSISGSQHAPEFEVAVIAGSRQIGKGTGRTKKAAMRAAAECALEQLDIEQTPQA